MNIKKWIKDNCASLSEKTIVITGTTGGLGHETLKILASLQANLIVGVRRPEVAKTQCKEIEKLTNCKIIQVLTLDLSDKNSIFDFSKQLDKLCPSGIDAFICNAAAYSGKGKPEIYGLQSHFFSNCIGTLYLSRLILPILNKKENSKLVIVSSLSYSFVKIDPNDIDKKTCKSKLKSYSNTKRWLTIGANHFKPEFEKEYKNVCVNICHPGICATSIISPKNGKIKKFLFKFVDIAEKIVFPSTKKQALNEVFAIYSKTKSGEWIGPSGKTKVYGKPKIQPLKLKFKPPETEEFVVKKIDEIIKNLDN